MLSAALLALAACLVSLVTLFSGFGLGTLLLPAFLLVFPAPVAVAATAVVHFLNNLFKLALLRRSVSRSVLLRFGAPAVLAAFPGAVLLARLSQSTRPIPFSIAGWDGDTTAVGLVMGILILCFAAMELVPALRRFRAPPRWLPLGGVLSGFFGGLSGHQGALRAAFLAPLELPPRTFAGTQTAIACLVDAARLLVYGWTMLGGHLDALHGFGGWGTVGAATAGAFLGAYAGSRLLGSVTTRLVRIATGVLLLVVGSGLALGVF